MGSAQPWAKVPVWVLTLGLSGADLAVYVAIRSYTDSVTGRAFPHVRTVADRACVSERTAARAIAHLRDLKVVTVQRWYKPDGSIGGCDYYTSDDPPGDTPVMGGTDRDDTTPPDEDDTRVLTGMAEQEQTSGSDQSEPTTTPGSEAQDAADVEALGMVVVGNTGTAGPRIDGPTLRAESLRLHGLGWTEAALKEAACGHGWTGAGPGAVIAWLRALGTPPAPRRAPAACGLCAGTGWLGEDDIGRPVRCACRLVCV